ncbi:MAG TPA: hypothetical protein VH333_18040 [Pseudonocardiaceae bacterium]|jgi:hypothetical protein|nr:hypothetical protein [Pseudonocardiaceae bacterium]
MRRTVVGVIAVVTASSVFSLVGMSTASAATALASTPPGASAAFSPVAEATTIRNLHDQLAAAWQAKDAVALQTTQTSLASELGKLQVPQRRTAMTADAVTTVGKATTQNDQLGQDLAALMATHGKAAGDLPLPGLGSLMTLVQSLLATLLSLVTGLLGGLPLPVGLPSLPVGAPSPGH